MTKPTPNEQWLDLNGYRLYVKTHPAPALAGERAPLVFLHEGLGSIGFWRDLPARLGEQTGRTAVVFDRRGYGRSSPCSEPRRIDYLHVEAYQYLPPLLDRLDIRRAVLIGHSDGGSIALLFAAKFPHRCTGIVTEAAHVFVDETTLAGIREAVTAYHGKLRSRLKRYHGEQTDAVFFAWADTWSAAWFRDWRITDDISAVQCPVLAIQGAADPYGEPAQIQAIVNSVAGPSRSLMLPKVGHTPHLEAREAFAAAVAEFVETLEE
ncbi:MAG: alpha/beta fold hydrolase [Desulfobacteraceae bacterium]|jgi:pimeloyl-ACP methyl ester carboxylesterase|nr:alpha/beta fold hydrolase [Desulfobacteraceae bacterium]